MTPILCNFVCKFGILRSNSRCFIKSTQINRSLNRTQVISQQVAKNVFLWQHGGYFRKGLEVYFTFMIETFWSKKRILEMYLNVAEMGEGIFGCLLYTSPSPRDRQKS